MIREMTISDAPALAAMAIKIWDSDDKDELEQEFIDMTHDKESTCFIKFIDAKAIGFANASLRHDYVEGCETSPVAYLEAIYEDKEYRLLGYAKDLVNRCEEWGREQVTKEFASDCILTNNDSYKFHTAIGFKEVNRIICFKKDISK
ncbi:MAG: GNAT family N-acetyltransferase [Eubacteriales bacterium]|uniref:aminoglycoside 6'-N-acetyltransferase n=1 Tax=Fenollaria sp. TaxID=1965292 RepID=UPI002A7538F8|nr:aminoglycoside 6'-N-acetyltransferase [Fenollaria sp.]MDD7339597.1 GNAT family N-acetyltransferase [Eubacteriales bacterium]MDY3106605.1 aminoglycoside 6'-N-acetyltransferase [Fenollaria sp.]